MVLPDQVARYREAIEEELRAILDGRDMLLYRMIRFHLGWVDEQGEPASGPPTERLRGFLCLATAEALEEEVGKALPAAAGVELINSFVQVHKDIEDGNLERQHRPAVWWIWGPAQAINAGDGLHALGRLALFRLLEHGVPAETVFKAIQALDRACLKLCEGQFLDVTYQERVDLTPQAYMAMVEARAGALMGCAMELGAFLATGEDRVLRACREAGTKLGVAFQLREDVLKLWGSGVLERPGADVLSKKKLLPVVYAFHKADVHKKRELGNLYVKRVLDAGDVVRVAAIVEEVGGRQYTQETAERLKEEALAGLKEVIPQERLGALTALANFMVGRDG
ncbi:MAG: polyprenyl synthetase family protein [Chloroflexi bacterium]|nr:polyprenyl synthetase family protein [Chloroflexota bacterium]